jgi:hypothetical protein
VSVARCLEINARLRAAGVTVHEWPGCWSRGNGLAPAYEGGSVHHTGSAYGFAYRTLFDGRSDLDGPLCNWAGNEDGSLTFIAAFPANHAGASGGKSMGPLPVTRLFNPRVLGLEIVYPGTSRMRDAQYRSACIWARVVADVVGGGDIERVRAHAETSITGKWDPGYALDRTIDMNQFRTDAKGARTALTQGDDVSWSDLIDVADGVPGYANDARLSAAAMLSEAHAFTKWDFRELGFVRATQAAHGQALAELLQLHGATPDAKAAEEMWARIEASAAQAAEKGAHDGLVESVLPALTRLAAELDADDAEQARAGAREVLAQLRDSLPAA